jgi:hypothetical protein
MQALAGFLGGGDGMAQAESYISNKANKYFIANGEERLSLLAAIPSERYAGFLDLKLKLKSVEDRVLETIGACPKKRLDMQLKPILDAFGLPWLYSEIKTVRDIKYAVSERDIRFLLGMAIAASIDYATAWKAGFKIFDPVWAASLEYSFSKYIFAADVEELFGERVTPGSSSRYRLESDLGAYIHEDIELDVRKAVGLWSEMDGGDDSPGRLAEICQRNKVEPGILASAYCSLAGGGVGMTLTSQALAIAIEEAMKSQEQDESDPGEAEKFRFPTELPDGLAPSMPLDALEMPPKYLAALSKSGIETLGDLASYRTFDIPQITGLKELGGLAYANIWQIIPQLKKLFKEGVAMKAPSTTTVLKKVEPNLPYQVSPVTSIYSLGLSSACARILRDCGILDASQLSRLKKGHVNTLKGSGVDENAILLAVKTASQLRKIFEERETAEKKAAPAPKPWDQAEFDETMKRIPKRRLVRPVSALVLAKPGLSDPSIPESTLIKDLGDLISEDKDLETLDKIKSVAQFAASDLRMIICRRLDLFFMGERCLQTFPKVKEWIINATDLPVKGNGALEQFRARLGLEISKIAMDPIPLVCADVGSPYWATDDDVSQFYSPVKENALWMAILRTPALYSSPAMVRDPARKGFIQKDAAPDMDKAAAVIDTFPSLGSDSDFAQRIKKISERENISLLALSIEFERSYNRGGAGACFKKSIGTREFMELAFSTFMPARFQRLSRSALEEFRRHVERLSLGAVVAPLDDGALSRCIEAFCLDCGDGTLLQSQELEPLADSVNAVWKEMQSEALDFILVETAFGKYGDRIALLNNPTLFAEAMKHCAGACVAAGSFSFKPQYQVAQELEALFWESLVLSEEEILSQFPGMTSGALKFFVRFLPGIQDAGNNWLVMKNGLPGLSHGLAEEMKKAAKRAPISAEMVWEHMLLRCPSFALAKGITSIDRAIIAFCAVAGGFELIGSKVSLKQGLNDESMEVQFVL